MKTIVKIIAMMLLLAGSFYSCRKNDTPKTMDINTFLEHLKSAAYVDVSKESLPEWLVARINDIEKRPSSISKVQIYKSDWDNQTVYFIMDTFSSCFCDFYSEKGERIVDNLSGLRVAGKNWTLIYEYGELP